MRNVNQKPKLERIRVIITPPQPIIEKFISICKNNFSVTLRQTF